MRSICTTVNAIIIIIIRQLQEGHCGGSSQVRRHCYFMCEVGVTTDQCADSEDSSISTDKVGQITVAETGLDRMQFIGCTTIPL